MRKKSRVGWSNKAGFFIAFDISSCRFPPNIVDVAAGEKFAVALASNGMVQPETLKPYRGASFARNRPPLRTTIMP